MKLEMQCIAKNPRVINQKEKLDREFTELVENFEYNSWDANVRYWEAMLKSFEELKRRIEDVNKSNQGRQSLELAGLTSQRNKLNRQISKLKKASPETN